MKTGPLTVMSEASHGCLGEDWPLTGFVFLAVLGLFKIILHFGTYKRTFCFDFCFLDFLISKSDFSYFPKILGAFPVCLASKVLFL